MQLVTLLLGCTLQSATVMTNAKTCVVPSSATVVLLCWCRYHRLLRKLSKKQRLKMNGGDYHAPKHIFGHASQEMSHAISAEAPAREAAGDASTPFQHLSALHEADCLKQCAV